MSARLVRSLSFVLALPPVLALPQAARADHCADASDQPSVCVVEAYGGFEAERLRSFDLDATIEMRPGQVLEIELDAFDQNKRRFPKHRLAFDFDDNNCRDIAKAEQTDIGRFEVVAGAEASGRCDIWLWVPGNLNLEWTLNLEVAQRSRAQAGYSTSEAQFVTQRLYQALLGREADPQGLRDTSSAIVRGDLDRRIDEILRSQEFRSRSRDAHPTWLLEQIYLGILGRKPDESGVRAFTGMIQRGGVGDVVGELLESNEFSQILARR